MRSSQKLYSTLVISVLVASVLSIPATNAANPDDGYPDGQAAPGRTCPNNDEGFKQVSTHNGKTLVCTVIDGVKKWWLDSEPLPVAPSKPVESSKPTLPTTDDNMPPGFKHTYDLPAKSLSKMKVFDDKIKKRMSIFIKNTSSVTSCP